MVQPTPRYRRVTFWLKVLAAIVAIAVVAGVQAFLVTQHRDGASPNRSGGASVDRTDPVVRMPVLSPSGEVRVTARLCADPLPETPTGWIAFEVIVGPTDDPGAGIVVGIDAGTVHDESSSITTFPGRLGDTVTVRAPVYLWDRCSGAATLVLSSTGASAPLGIAVRAQGGLRNGVASTWLDVGR